MQDFYENLDRENKHLITLKDENYRLTEDNERLRAHYEVLKEHELSIIKDYEAKLQREQLMGEQKLQEVKVQVKDTVNI